jgi:hypothetical protein
LFKIYVLEALSISSAISSLKLCQDDKLL